MISMSIKDKPLKENISILIEKINHFNKNFNKDDKNIIPNYSLNILSKNEDINTLKKEIDLIKSFINNNIKEKLTNEKNINKDSYYLMYQRRPFSKNYEEYIDDIQKKEESIKNIEESIDKIEILVNEQNPNKKSLIFIAILLLSIYTL